MSIKLMAAAILTLAATNSYRSNAELTTKQSSNTTWTNFATHCSEKATCTMAFQVSKPSYMYNYISYNSRTKQYFANSIQENVTRNSCLHFIYP